MKYLTFCSALIFIVTFESCRDYAADVEDKTPPEITTEAENYVIGDTVSVSFKNIGSSTLYVTGVYNVLEKKNSSDWEIYSIYTCGGGCPEFPVYSKSTIFGKISNINSGGIYRLVCAYSTKSGEIYERKNKAYSNEFNIITR